MWTVSPPLFFWGLSFASILCAEDCKETIEAHTFWQSYQKSQHVDIFSCQLLFSTVGSYSYTVEIEVTINSNCNNQIMMMHSGPTKRYRVVEEFCGYHKKLKAKGSKNSVLVHYSGFDRNSDFTLRYRAVEISDDDGRDESIVQILALIAVPLIFIVVLICSCYKCSYSSKSTRSNVETDDPPDQLDLGETSHHNTHGRSHPSANRNHSNSPAPSPNAPLSSRDVLLEPVGGRVSGSIRFDPQQPPPSYEDVMSGNVRMVTYQQHNS